MVGTTQLVNTLARHSNHLRDLSDADEVELLSHLMIVHLPYDKLCHTLVN